MNERIKELALEADEYCRDYVPNWTMDNYNLKFAELIVRECAKVLDDKLANPNGASIAYCDGSDLKEHFGVGE